MSGCGLRWCEQQNDFTVDTDGSVLHTHRSVEEKFGSVRVWLEGSFTAGTHGLEVVEPGLMISGTNDAQGEALTAEDAYQLQLHIETLVVLRATREGRRPVL
jgi:hypothetical protein